MLAVRRPRSRYAANQALRRCLIEKHGIEGWRVSATPDAKLRKLKQQAIQLTLVVDVEELNRAERIQAMFDECDPGEIASIRTYALGRFVEQQELLYDQMTPWDTFDGPKGAA